MPISCRALTIGRAAGIYDKALSHLEKAETRTKSEGTRTHALLLRILVLIDSPDTVAQRYPFPPRPRLHDAQCLPRALCSPCANSCLDALTCLPTVRWRLRH